MGGKRATGSPKPIASGSPPVAAPAPVPLFVPTLPTLPTTACTPEEILFGPVVEPQLRIKGYSEDEFENFVREWAYLHEQLQKGRYVQVGRFGGAGDMGRDVVGYIDPPSSGGRLDIFQCKHYDHALYPTDVWAEIGKLCYYTHVKAFAVPEQYRLVAPEDVGAELGRYLEKPAELKQKLIDAWDEHVASKIIRRQQIKLEGELLAHVQAFDFCRIGCKPLHEILEDHKKTNRYAPRFGGGLIFPSKPDPVPPDVIETHEQRYVEQLVEAYQSHKDDSVKLETIASHPEFHPHFCRSRERYFCAESLRLTVRDGLPAGVTFEQVQEDVRDTVIDTAESEHTSGFVRVKAVTDHSVRTATNHPLKAYLKSKVLHGICHQLANTDRLRWVI